MGGSATCISAEVIARFLRFGDGPTDAVIVNNDEWLSSLAYLDFLREYGRHFTINRTPCQVLDTHGQVAIRHEGQRCVRERIGVLLEQQ